MSLKKYCVLLVAILLVPILAQAESTMDTITIDFSKYKNDVQPLADTTINRITFSSPNKGGVYKSDGTFHLSGRDSITVLGNGVKILKISFGNKSGKIFRALNSDVGSYSNMVWTGSASDIVFTNSTSNMSYIASITVIYEITEALPATPTITPNGGNVHGNEPISLSSDDDATIYYTLDGTVPTAQSTRYTAQITLTKSSTVKAIAIRNGARSAVATASFNAVSYASKPVITVDKKYNVSITANGAENIYYTTNGKQPSDTSLIYTKPFRTLKDINVSAASVDEYGVQSDTCLSIIDYIYKGETDESIAIGNILSETFDSCDTNGGNDGDFSGVSNFSAPVFDNSGWERSSFYKSNYCAKGGTATDLSYLITPTLTKLSGDAMIVYRAASWANETTTLYFEVYAGEGTLSKGSQQLKRAEFITDTLFVYGGNSETRIKIYTQSVDQRFFIDDINISSTHSKLTVSSAGFATYSGWHDLDIAADAPINAYTASINSGVVTFSKCNQIKAGEGYLLRSVSEGAAQYEAPFSTLPVAPVANNALKACLDTTIIDASDNAYVLQYRNNDVNFFRVSNNITIPAGRAWLVSDASNAKLKVVFNDVTPTKITSHPTTEISSSNIYNLSGQRVISSYKGLVIKGHKKVLLK